jgi:hypothetical protein
MPVIQGIHVDVDASRILKNEGCTDHKLIVEAAGWAADRASDLARPAATYRFLKVNGISDRTLKAEDKELIVGPLVGLLKPAEEILVGVATLGSDVEMEVRALKDSGQFLKSYLLDSAAFVVLDQATRALRSVAESEASRRGWGVGAALSPGALAGWDLSDQATLCSLVDLAAIGIELSPSQLLKPSYSLSVLIGLGKGYGTHKVSDTCAYCSLGKSCQYRCDGL